MKDSRNLKGQIKKTSNVLCEYIITSDKAFFDSLDENEQKRFFKTAYSFVCNYKQLGEQNIIEAVIHNDETTPHMHLVFIPIVYTRDKNNNPIEKISCSEFWKGKNSYSNLQDSFYKYISKSNFNLERGERNSERVHIDTKDFKEITRYDLQQYEKDNARLIDVPTLDNLPSEELKRIIKRVKYERDVLSSRYTKITNIVTQTQMKNDSLKTENQKLQEELYEQYDEIDKLENKIKEIYEALSCAFQTSISKLKQLVKLFINNR